MLYLETPLMRYTSASNATEYALAQIYITCIACLIGRWVAGISSVTVVGNKRSYVHVGGVLFRMCTSISWATMKELLYSYF